MKLNELKTSEYRKLTRGQWNAPIDIINWMEDHNFELIDSSGKSALVFLSDTKNS